MVTTILQNSTQDKISTLHPVKPKGGELCLVQSKHLDYQVLKLKGVAKDRVQQILLNGLHIGWTAIPIWFWCII